MKKFFNTTHWQLPEAERRLVFEGLQQSRESGLDSDSHKPQSAKEVPMDPEKQQKDAEERAIKAAENQEVDAEEADQKAAEISERIDELPDPETDDTVLVKADASAPMEAEEATNTLSEMFSEENIVEFKDQLLNMLQNAIDALNNFFENILVYIGMKDPEEVKSIDLDTELKNIDVELSNKKAELAALGETDENTEKKIELEALITQLEENRKVLLKRIEEKKEAEDEASKKETLVDTDERKDSVKKTVTAKLEKEGIEPLGVDLDQPKEKLSITFEVGDPAIEQTKSIFADTVTFVEQPDKLDGKDVVHLQTPFTEETIVKIEEMLG